MRTLLLLLAGLAAACSPTPEQTESSLGTVDFQATGREEAQADFHQGLLLLHSFEYDDALEAFAAARDKDSTMAMAYWGEAMAHNHPLWQEQDFEKGNEVLQALAPTADERVAKAATGLEKDFMAAVNILYGAGDKATRDSSYAEFMGTLYDKYPGNDEVAAFYSLSLNGWGTTDKNKATLEKAASIGFEVLKRNPKHPGALHYIIHAYDDPKYAEEALQVANEYAKVAPAAGHALHMPTHTYVALGLWDKVVNSNIESWNADKARKERKGLDNDALGYHMYHWLQYGYLQRGETDIARRMLDSMAQYCNELPSGGARSHLVYLKTTYLSETGEYAGDLPGLPVDLKGLNISVQAKDHFVRGMALYERKEKASLDSLLKAMADHRVTEKLKTPEKGIRMCGNISRSMPTQSDLDMAEAMEMQLRAMRAMLDSDAATAETFLQKACAIEDAVGYAYGPPDIVKPTHEFYAEWLLEQGRPKDAEAQYDLALQLAPNRRLSVLGKERAGKSL